MTPRANTNGAAAVATGNLIDARLAARHGSGILS
jgi:hypothetical protein